MVDRPQRPLESTGNGALGPPPEVDGAAGRGPIGRVASPLGQEATTAHFSFWVAPEVLVEKGQLVVTESAVGGQDVRFFGVVEEVYRRSRARDMGEEVDTFDGDLAYEPPFRCEGLTYAEATTLYTTPPLLTPPLEQSLVALGDATDAAVAYGYEAMVDAESGVDWGLPIGLLRNGRAATLGVAKIDLRDLGGDRAGHLNVTGQAGHGTKSSFLLVVVRALIDTARRWDDGDPNRPAFSVRPIVFNVKGNDLMYVDAPNKHLTAEQRALWARLGLVPRPFEGAEFVAPCHGDGSNRGLARVNRKVASERQTRPYYWTLADVVRFGLWSYLFSEEAQQNELMMLLADHVLGLIAKDRDADPEHPAGLELRSPDPDDRSLTPQSFAELRTYLRAALADTSHPIRGGGIFPFGTCRALLSRLGLVFGREGQTIFDSGTRVGAPLRVIASGTTDPLVIDIAALPHELRRFVVAAVLDQVKTHQMGPRRVPGQVYFLVLDELGLYAPRGGRDPITRLCEHVAAQLRSQGVILLGAQQQASKVSETIFGNSEVKVVGASSPVELEAPTWRHLLTPAQKARALMLGPEEKLVLVPRGWMNVRVPFPAWAMKETEIDGAAVAGAALAGVGAARGAPVGDGAGRGIRIRPIDD